MPDISYDELIDALSAELTEASVSTQPDRRAVIAYCVTHLVDDPNDWADIVRRYLSPECTTGNATVYCAVCRRPVDSDSAHFVDGREFGVLGEVEVHAGCCPDCRRQHITARFRMTLCHIP